MREAGDCTRVIFVPVYFFFREKNLYDFNDKYSLSQQSDDSLFYSVCYVKKKKEFLFVKPFFDQTNSCIFFAFDLYIFYLKVMNFLAKKQKKLGSFILFI
jgi:hypothetical protein